MALFEGYERRIDKINEVLKEYGISSVEECIDICLSKGVDCDKIVRAGQPICFENAVWAYTVGSAIAIKKGCVKASDAAAAIGIGLNVLESKGNMVVDIGGGTSEIAVIALGGIISNKSIKTAGDEFNSDIEDYMRKEHNISIGKRTAELIKMTIGAATPDIDNPPAPYEVRGRDLVTGIPKALMVSHQEIAIALDSSISQVEVAVLNALEQTPAELSADIYESGIWLAGGGALLRGLDKRIQQKTKLDVHIAEDPLRAVARGTAIALKNFDGFTFLKK